MQFNIACVIFKFEYNKRLRFIAACGDLTLTGSKTGRYERKKLEIK